MEKKWYYSKWFIILSLIYLMPLGLFLMWEGKIFTKKTRIVISTIIAIISALLFITSVNTKPLTPEQEKSRIEYEQAQREARKAKEEQEKLKKTDEQYKNKLEKSFKDKNGDELIALYNNATDNQKAIFTDMTTREYMKWLSEFRDKDRFSIALNEELNKYYSQLAFLDQINDNRLEDLKAVRNAIGNKMISQDDINLFIKEHNMKDAKVFENFNDAETITAYVTQRVSGAFNIKILGNNIGEGYTDEYLINSYKYYGNISVPDDSWEAIITFKKTTNVKQGLMTVQAIKIADKKYERSGGFEVTLPVYAEITQADIEYSRKVMAYRAANYENLQIINNAITKYVPAKK